MTIPSIARALAEGETSAEILTRDSLDRIRAEDGAIRAFLSLHEDRALARAREIDTRLAAGETLLEALVDLPEGGALGLDEQVVHRAEVVAQQAQRDAGGGGDAAACRAKRQPNGRRRWPSPRFSM